MAGKEWADRLPLDDLRGCILFGAALCHLLKALQDQRAAFEDSLVSVGVKAMQTKRQEGRIDDAVEIQDSLKLLGSTPSEWEAAKLVRFSDFRFFPENLFQRPHLTFFVVPKASRFYPEIEQDIPIARFFDAPLQDLIGLFRFWWSYHVAPIHAKPSPCELEHLGFPRTPEHYHFLNYVAIVCEEPPPKNRPSGSGYRDAAGSAAGYAWTLLYNAGKEGRSLSIAEAVRQSIACFEIASPMPKSARPTRDLSEVIEASSKEQAAKRVRKRLEAIIAREPPWQMPPPLPVVDT